MNKSMKKTGMIIAAVAVIAVAVILFMTAFVTVPTGHTGVVVTFGRVEDYVLEEGVHFKLPWQNVVKMDNRAQKETVSLQAFSSDIQQVDVVCSVNFSVDRETSQNLYRNIGAYYYGTVVEPRILHDVKSVFAKYSAENLISSREMVPDEIYSMLAPEMKEYGIEIISISVENIDFTDVFTDAVEAKQVAEQSKLQAQIEQAQKTMEYEAEAERKVIEAEAEAEVLKIQSDADAYATKVQAEAKAEANKDIANSVTELLVKYIEASNWNGQLPEIYSGSGELIPVINNAGEIDLSE